MFVSLILLGLFAGALARPSKNTPACGVSKYFDAGEKAGNGPSQMIVGGVHARAHEFPWQVSLQRKPLFSTEYVHFCGGHIINEEWIMTAAHCVSFGFLTRNMRVVTGEHDQMNPSPNRNVHEVAELIPHENFDLSTNQNDIALIRLKNKISFTKNVQPICLPDPSTDFSSMECVVSGWGALYEGHEGMPDVLRYTRLPIMSKRVCSQRYKTIRGSPAITEDMLCAGHINNDQTDACQGDSGGPLVCKMDDGSHQLAGVVSWGIGCASGMPGVFSNVQYFLDWVENNMY